MHSPYFHCILFFDLFSNIPIPSNTLVMSYIRRFWTDKCSAARFKSRTPLGEDFSNATNFFVSKPNDVSNLKKIILHITNIYIH